ncbi:MAG: EAL domain-containing protein [Sphingomonadales bacterium]|nr:EAL domain-containing protein [Sphingomonadales bacterium]
MRIYAQFVAMMGPEYSATCFQNALEALEYLNGNEADLLIVDYRMPELNGADFIRAVRAKTSGSYIPAIIITARQDRECRIIALDAGATDFLQSPVSDTEFRERALLLLAQHRKEKELAARMASNPFNTHASEIENVSINSTKSMLEQIIDTTPILINATDRNGKILFMNSYQSQLFGKEPDQLVGKSLMDILESDFAQQETRRNAAVLETGRATSSYEQKYISDGVDLTFHCTKSPLSNIDGQTIGVLTTGVDITARKFAEEHRTHLALHDMLTGLPNRVLLSERMRSTIEDCVKNDKIAALLLLDLDRFKVINDTRGHQAGDMLLRQVADRISNIIGSHDFAARIGGDEFAIILNNVRDTHEISAKCTKLLSQIGLPYSIGGVEQLIGVSIGVTMIPEDNGSSDELLRLADLAMYEAKSKGRNCHCFFSPRLNQIAQFNASLETDLREGLEKDQFFLEYQPIVETASGVYVGLEALIRWNHPARGLLLPSDFMRIANDSGLIDRIGSWVIEAACKQISAFNSAGVDIPHIAVNVSPRQFENQNMSDTILGNIEKYMVPAGKLSVEITEELLLDHNQHVHNELIKLRENGVDISIDDFGTGYSSLQYLRDLPATRLKIDRTFISRIEYSAADRAIISTIAHLAHALDMRVIAEGVETEAQYALLRASGCDEVQGFLVGRPLSVDQLHTLFDHGPTRFVIGQ